MQSRKKEVDCGMKRGWGAFTADIGVFNNVVDLRTVCFSDIRQLGVPHLFPVWHDLGVAN
jgi:hypothetical protein